MVVLVILVCMMLNSYCDDLCWYTHIVCGDKEHNKKPLCDYVMQQKASSLTFSLILQKMIQLCGVDRIKLLSLEQVQRHRISYGTRFKRVRCTRHLQCRFAKMYMVFFVLCFLV